MQENSISVIIPVYNAANFLPRCLDSLLVQAYKNFEVILIDDGSTDNSFNICKAIESRDKRFTVVHTENHGVSTARNLGLDMAKGDWICFLDADDSITGDLFEKLMQRVNAISCDYVRFNYKRINKNEDPLKCCLDDGSSDCWHESGQEMIKKLDQTHYLYTVWSAIFRRLAIEKISLRFKVDFKVGEDDLFGRLFLIQCGRSCYANGLTGYNYFQNEDSAIRSMKFEDEHLCAIQQLDVFQAINQVVKKQTSDGGKVLLHRIARKLPFVGRTRRYPRLRPILCEYLAQNALFNKEVIPTLFRIGSISEKCFALLYLLTPYPLRWKFLNIFK